MNQVENWPFCTSADVGKPCQGAVGAGLDLTLSITGAGDAVNKDGATFSGLAPTAADASLVLSQQVSWISYCFFSTE